MLFTYVRHGTTLSRGMVHISCAKTNSTTEHTVTDTTSISTESIRASHRDRVEEQTRLTDMTSNGLKWNFFELNEGTFDSLQLLTKRTSIFSETIHKTNC